VESPIDSSQLSDSFGDIKQKPAKQQRIEEMQAAWLNKMPQIQFSDAERTLAGLPPADAPAFSDSDSDTGSEFPSAPIANARDFSTSEETSPIKMVELGELKTDDVNQIQHAEINWRQLVEQLNAPALAAEQILRTAFANETEKHVAAQCLALLSGDLTPLETWHWQVWRNPNSFEYPITPVGRENKNPTFRFYDQPLHRLVKMLAPLIFANSKSKFLIEGKLASLGIQSFSKSSLVGHSHPAIQRGVFKFFEQQANELRLKFADTPGLAAQTFFDHRTKTIHFDAKWQMELPPGVLAYKILETVHSIQRRNEGIPLLNPISDVLPVIGQVRQFLTSRGISRLKIAFGIEQQNVTEFIKTVNKDDLISLINQCGTPSIADISTLQNEIRLKSLSKILASTLDVVGILESLAGKSLCEPGVLKHQAIVYQHALAADILKAAAKLNF
jgi:hypothetical protein